MTNTGQAVVDDLVRLLDLQPAPDDRIGQSVFRGVSPAVALQRVFGGQVAAQALVAAGRTVDRQRVVHSLHAYFIRPGDPTVPIDYSVDTVRDGRSFSVRRVVARQQDSGQGGNDRQDEHPNDKVIFTLSASFQAAQPGIEVSAAMPDVPPPDGLPTLSERFEQFPDPTGRARLPRPFDMRYVDDPPWARTGAGRPQRVWMRAAGVLPDDPLTHVCAVTFGSDLTLLESVLISQGLSFGGKQIVAASLDHAMWFHRPFRADEWFLYESEAVSASGSRGLAQGKIFAADGQHLATVMQEGMIRIDPESTG